MRSQGVRLTKRDYASGTQCPKRLWLETHEPDAVELWQGRPGRMHDRLVYRRTGEAWSVHRLAP